MDMGYSAPVRDMLFVMRELAGLADVQALPGFEDATDDTVAAVLEENARFNAEVIAPLNQSGDTAASIWTDGQVTTAPGFKQAFRQFAEAGWQGVSHAPEYGGQGLPKLVGTSCLEMLFSANLSFSLIAMLSDGAIEALMTAGSEQQKKLFIPPMIDGSWTGTMNLTETNAGSDGAGADQGRRAG
jgi:3-(methylthio)propanoyl-CoA dehydrogenase